MARLRIGQLLFTLWLHLTWEQFGRCFPSDYQSDWSTSIPFLAFLSCSYVGTPAWFLFVYQTDHLRIYRITIGGDAFFLYQARPASIV